MYKNRYAVIMAGGVGSRFWPFSRADRPKQFHDVLGTGKSLLQETSDRLEGLCPPENVFVVTNSQYVNTLKEQLPFLKEHQILAEPIGRNTAPCIAYSCHKIYTKNKHAEIIVTPADHVILKPDKFRETAALALDLCSEQDILITLGMKPQRPDTGYGYIQVIDNDGSSPLRKVKTFTEKPDEELAKQFLESGEFVWNAGIFIFSASSIIRALKKHLPEMYAVFKTGDKHYYKAGEKEFIKKVYSECKNISIDYGIMEKADNVYVIPSDFGWSDLGTWRSLYEILPKDELGNVKAGQIRTYDTKNCIIRTSAEKLTVIQGLNGYIVAEENGIVMICQKDKEQMVKNFVADLKTEGKTNFL